MTDQPTDRPQPAADVPIAPLPPEVTEHPAWRMIWRKLLAPTPDELAAAAQERERADTERDVA